MRAQTGVGGGVAAAWARTKAVFWRGTLAGYLASACGGSPGAPSTAASSLAAGQWTGTTAQGTAITFVVSSNETLTSIAVGYSSNRLCGTRDILEPERPYGAERHMYSRTLFRRHILISSVRLLERPARDGTQHDRQRPLSPWQPGAGPGYVSGPSKLRNRCWRGVDGDEALIGPA